MRRRKRRKKKRRRVGQPEKKAGKAGEDTGQQGWEECQTHVAKETSLSLLFLFHFLTSQSRPPVYHLHHTIHTRSREVTKQQVPERNEEQIFFFKYLFLNPIFSPGMMQKYLRSSQSLIPGIEIMMTSCSKDCKASLGISSHGTDFFQFIIYLWSNN